MKTLKIRHRRKTVWESVGPYHEFDVKKHVKEITYIVELTEKEYLYVLEKEKKDGNGLH